MAPLSNHIGDILISLEEAVESWTEQLNCELPVPDACTGAIVSSQHAEICVLENDAPACPKCGAPMEKRNRHDDQLPFWGCSAYPKCQGTRRYKVGFAPGYLLPQNVLLHFAGKTRINQASVLDHEAWIGRVQDMGAEIFGTYAATDRWLDRPKISLRGKSPRAMMESVEGCCMVLFMLETYYDWDLTTTAVPR